jgi:pimeloyl-ACP methyl ester carboxylesterase
VQIAVNGTRLWFDVEGPALVPEGAHMRERPTLVLVHGGPGSYDHSYFKPWFGRLADRMQVVYVDLRDHGRSARHDPENWTFETCADDLRAFCDAVGIEPPVVLGHSMGGVVALLFAARHPGHVAGLVLQSTMARLDLDRLAEGFRRMAGEEVATLARRDYGGDDVTDDEWARVFATFGPHVPTPEELGRRTQNLAVGPVGMQLLRMLDLRDALAAVPCPVLVSVGVLDPVTPLEAASEIAEGLPPGRARLEVLQGAGHFPWLDVPEAYWGSITSFVDDVAGTVRS